MLDRWEIEAKRNPVGIDGISLCGLFKVEPTMYKIETITIEELETLSHKVSSDEYLRISNTFMEEQPFEEYLAFVYRCLTESSWKYTSNQAFEIINRERNVILQCYNAKDSVSDCTIEVGYGCG